MFKLNGLGGFFLLVLVLVLVWGGLVAWGVQVQQDSATDTYQISPSE